MTSLFSLLRYIGIDDIFGILSLIGLASFLVRRFVLHKSPVPSGTFGKVSPELLQECVALLQKKEGADYEEYVAPPQLLDRLRTNPGNVDYLKELLCDICAHVGIDGDFIKLVLEDEPLPEGLADGLFGEVVVGGAQAAGGDDDVGPLFGQSHRLLGPLEVVPHHGVPKDVQPQLAQPLGEHLGVGVGDVAQEQLGAHR